jgi:actin-related protein
MAVVLNSPRRTPSGGSARGSRHFLMSRSSQELTNRSASLPAVVLEWGSEFVRVGWTGESNPRHVIPSFVVGNHSNGTSMTEQEWRGVLYPFLSRVVTDLLLLAAPKNRRVVVLEPMVAPATVRAALAHVLLNELAFHAVLFVPGPISIPYALSTPTTTQQQPKLLIDVGATEARIVAVEGGRYLMDTFQAVPCGFHTLASTWMDLVNNNNIKTTQDQDGTISIPTLQDATRLLSQVLLVPAEQSSQAIVASLSTTDSISLDPTLVMELVEELYFNLNNPESLVCGVLEALRQCPLDLKLPLAQSMVVVGGGSLAIPNLEKRLLEALSSVSVPPKYASLSPILSKASLVSPLPIPPHTIAWVGASILASLELKDEYWMTIPEPPQPTDEIMVSSSTVSSPIVRDFFQIK